MARVPRNRQTRVGKYIYDAGVKRNRCCSPPLFTAAVHRAAILQTPARRIVVALKRAQKCLVRLVERIVAGGARAQRSARATLLETQARDPPSRTVARAETGDTGERWISSFLPLLLSSVLLLPSFLPYSLSLSHSHGLTLH